MYLGTNSRTAEKERRMINYYLALCSGGSWGLRLSGHDSQTRRHTPSSSASGTGRYRSGSHWDRRWGTLLQKGQKQKKKNPHTSAVMLKSQTKEIERIIPLLWYLSEDVLDMQF